MTPRLFLWVCLGGAAGTGARYLTSVWALRAFGPAFPYGTLIVNVLGSFLLGVVMQVGLTTELISPGARVVLASGVMGGFTTYSSFNYETLQCLQEGRIGVAAANLAVTVLACLLAGGLGLATGRLFTGR